MPLGMKWIQPKHCASRGEMDTIRTLWLWGWQGYDQDTVSLDGEEGGREEGGGGYTIKALCLWGEMYITNTVPLGMNGTQSKHCTSRGDRDAIKKTLCLWVRGGTHCAAGGERDVTKLCVSEGYSGFGGEMDTINQNTVPLGVKGIQ